MAQNGNRAKRKCHTSFFVFDLLKMKFVPIDSALILHKEVNLILFKKWVWYLEKQPNLKKWFEI